MMWNGKKKAVTFSFDDGVTQDIRLIELLDRYDLKATFNLNSSLLGLKNTLNVGGVEVDQTKVPYDCVGEIYKNHEVAVHTLTHPCLPQLDERAIVWQVEQDRATLEMLTGKKVRGMAYPCGGVNNDDRVASVLRERTAIRYARTITSTYAFSKQENLLRFNPTISYTEPNLFEVVETFLRSKGEDEQLLYIWGHAYELDARGTINWQSMEELCRLLSHRPDVYYGTNEQVLF